MILQQMVQKRKQRKYQPAWEQIKKRAVDNKSLTLEVHPTFFSRVIKAIIKEKNNDLGFKVLNSSDNYRLVITQKPKDSRLIFKLKATLGLEDIILP